MIAAWVFVVCALTMSWCATGRRWPIGITSRVGWHGSIADDLLLLESGSSSDSSFSTRLTKRWRPLAPLIDVSKSTSCSASCN